MKYQPFSGIAAAVSVSLLLAACQTATSPQAQYQPSFPGTTQRPVLSSDEAARFTQQHYFAYRGLYASPIADAWTPQPINIASVNTPYVVGPAKGIDGANYTQIQDVVNVALQQQKGHQRIYIKVQPGTYIGTVDGWEMLIDYMRVSKADGSQANDLQRDALIAERTTAGLASARARGRKGGRPYKMTPAKLRLALASMGSCALMGKNCLAGSDYVLYHLDNSPILATGDHVYLH